MNIRTRAEREIVKNINSMSLEEIYLDSLVGQLETSMIMMKLINQRHRFVVPVHLASTCSSVRRGSVAA